MFTWGFLSAAMMFISTPLQFYVMRFLLGVAEAGFYPCLIYYFASWFPMSHRGRAISRFYVSSPLASIVMGAMSGWLLGLDGAAGLQGWQWLFLVQGLPSIAMGLVLLRFLPDAPASAAWLTAEEKGWIAGELAREAAQIGEPKSHNPLASLRNPRVLLLSATGFFTSGIMTTVALSAPLVLLAQTGLVTTQVGYLVSVGGVLGAILMLFAGGYADRRGDRFLNAFWFIVVTAGALLIMAIAPSPLLVMVAYLVVAATCFTVSMLLSSGWADVLHLRELAVGAAAINSVCNLGGFVMPFAWGAARDATGTFTLGLMALAILSLVAAGLSMLVRAEVRRKKKVSA
jgi:ACS family tartrate transporter-like MFS transporter